MSASRAARLFGWLLIPATGAALLGQYALDANLQVGGGRVNPASGYAMPLGRDVYRINRDTGTFQYYQRGAYGWSPQRYTVRTQEQLMNSGVMSTYSRPAATMGPYAWVYDQNSRTGAYRYNDAHALSRRGYNVYQSARPTERPQKPIEIGESTPTYRAAPRTPEYHERSATIPMTNQPGYEQVRSSGVKAAVVSAGNITNLTPQVYRPPYVRLNATDD